MSLTLAQINKLAEQARKPHHIAKFKAKFGISNRVLANFLAISSSEATKHIADDSFSKDQNKLILNVQDIIEHLVNESEILQDQAPHIMVLTHDLEMAERSIKTERKTINKLESELNFYRKQSFWKRLWHLFKPHSNQEVTA